MASAAMELGGHSNRLRTAVEHPLTYGVPSALKNVLVPEDVARLALVSVTVCVTVDQPANKAGDTGSVGSKPGVPGRFATSKCPQKWRGVRLPEHPFPPGRAGRQRLAIVLAQHRLSGR
jgi:hypothetical protein